MIYSINYHPTETILIQPFPYRILPYSNSNDIVPHYTSFVLIREATSVRYCCENINCLRSSRYSYIWPYMR